MIIRGKVIKGDQKGKKQGFPTANLNPALAKNLSRGVSACLAFHKNKICPAILIYGAPDKNNKAKLEVFFLKKCQNIYGQFIKVKKIRKIRALLNFKTKKKFINQAKNDIKKTKTLLKNI